MSGKIKNNLFFLGEFMNKFHKLMAYSTMLALTSCGFFNKFSSSEGPTEEKVAGDSTINPNSQNATASDATKSGDTANIDDLFANTAAPTPAATPTPTTDAPTNVPVPIKEELAVAAVPAEASAPTPAPAEAPAPIPAPVPAAPPTPTPAVTQAPVVEEERHASGDGRYTVKKGETLMQIAFKLYGDTNKWKELKSLNKDQLRHGNQLSANMKLKYTAPEKPFHWEPSGTPYLIKSGDTLGRISNQVYQTPKKWKMIFENNRPLIKNANLIYAGFTLYYPGASVAEVEDKISPNQNNVDIISLSNEINDEASKIEAATKKEEVREDLTKPDIE